MNDIRNCCNTIMLRQVTVKNIQGGELNAYYHGLPVNKTYNKIRLYSKEAAIIKCDLRSYSVLNDVVPDNNLARCDYTACLFVMLNC